MSRSRSKIWKISPGRNARFWDAFRGQGIIAIGWLEELGDLRKIVEYEEIRKLAIKKGSSQSAINQTWDFYKNVNINDLVVAFGRGSLLDVGRVVGPYYYDDSVESYFDDENTYVHRRKVEWFEVFPKPLKIKDNKELYPHFRWPQDTIHEIADANVKRRIEGFILGREIIPSKIHILRAIEEIGKTEIKRNELLEKIAKIIETEGGQRLRPNWQKKTWERIKNLAEEVIEE